MGCKGFRGTLKPRGAEQLQNDNSAAGYGREQVRPADMLSLENYFFILMADVGSTARAKVKAPLSRLMFVWGR